MDWFRKIVACLVLGVVFMPVPVVPQEAPKPLEASKAFKPEELDQLVAPIALHPDSLLAQVLMASTYPLEIVQASRFVKDNQTLKGDQLNQALQQYSWDDSVKSLVFFPQVLAMMNEKLDWLQKLGDAFLAQQQDVMAAVQRLRARAQASGHLKSTPEQQVTVEPAASPPTAGAPPAPPAGAPPAPPQPGQTTVEVTQAAPTVIRIEPTSPEVVYVPSYNPTVVYGAWPPAYPPYYPYPAGYFAAGAFTFMAGAAVGAALWGNCNWGGGDVDINTNRQNNFTRNVNNNQQANARIQQRQSARASGSGAAGQGRSQWQHNPEHRKGVQYRDNATQQRFNKSGPGNAQSREQFRGRDQGGLGDRGQSGLGDRGKGGPGDRGQSGLGDRGQGGPGDRGQSGLGDRGQGGLGDRGQGGLGDRGAQAGTRDRQGVGQGGGSGQARQAGAFQGAGGGGRDAQSFSNRGNASRESFSRSSGGGSRGAGGGGRSGGGGGGGRGGRR